MKHLVNNIAVYICYRKKVIAMFCMCFLITAVIFYLYWLPLSSVSYAAAICFFVLFLYAYRDFKSFLKKHCLLNRLAEEKDSMLSAVDQLLDEAGKDEIRWNDTILERDYKKLIDALCEWEKMRLEKENKRFCDMIEYYSVWAHQIKTPIAAMRLLLQEEELSAQEIKTELQRIEQYVEMVLCYLRLDSDSTDYVIREYSMDRILRQAIRSYSGQFIRRKIRLEYIPTEYIVLTDEKWLLFVLEQILSNAIKYTQQSQGRISVRMEKETLIVEDNGIGIAPEDLPRIFEKGYTGYNGRYDKKASGIGLYLCRRICRQLGHEIRAESKLGEGTKVFLKLEHKKQEYE